MLTHKDVLSRLRRDSSKSGAAAAQHFFGERVVSFGWRTPELEAYARELRSQLSPEQRIALSKTLISGASNEEFHLAVFLLEKWKGGIAANFPLYEQMIKSIDNWAKCDCLSMRLIGLAFVEKPALAERATKWAKSKNIWHCRAAAASLTIPARRRICHPIMLQVSSTLLPHPHLMVQKGVGWLLRELGKASPEVAMPFLMKNRDKTTRLVLRTACEKLSAAEKKRVLAPTS